MMHHGMPLQHLSSNHMQRTSMGGGQPRLCFAGISWRHVRQGSMDMTQSKEIKWMDQSCKQRNGREHLGGETPWSTRSQSNKGAWSTLEKIEVGRGSEDPKKKGSSSSKPSSTTSLRRHSVSESPRIMEEDTAPPRRNDTLLLGGMRVTRSSSTRFTFSS